MYFLVLNFHGRAICVGCRWSRSHLSASMVGWRLGAGKQHSGVAGGDRCGGHRVRGWLSGRKC